MSKEWLSLREASKQYGISRSTIVRRIKRGEIEGYKVGRTNGEFWIVEPPKPTYKKLRGGSSVNLLDDSSQLIPAQAKTESSQETATPSETNVSALNHQFMETNHRLHHSESTGNAKELSVLSMGDAPPISIEILKVNAKRPWLIIRLMEHKAKLAPIHQFAHDAKTKPPDRKRYLTKGIFVITLALLISILVLIVFFPKQIDEGVYFSKLILLGILGTILSFSILIWLAANKFYQWLSRRN